ncbi:N-acetyltransferase family protein [Streptomyces sp. CG1]|uniref:GNAT family N-acetyltransferase n=1 Tax=Streptomyces sp. CG1 TaxID=1287523 RepID=UPI0034E2D672
MLANERVAYYVAGWPRPGDMGVVAFAAGQARVRAVWLRLFDSGRPGYGYAGDGVPELTIGVVRSWRGRGVGRALLREAARLAAEAGFRQISLNVVPSNPAAALYREEGFTTVKIRPDGLTMVKPLPPLPTPYRRG